MTRDQLLAELAVIDERSKRRQAAADRDRDRRIEIDRELRKLNLVPLIGIAGGVMLRFRGWDHRIPDDATGTLTKIARTRAHVDFGEHGKWTVPADVLIATAQHANRGYTLRFGQAG